jgi:hypothetical protein
LRRLNCPEAADRLARKREQIRKQLSALRKQHGADAVRLMFDVQLARRHPNLRKRLSPEAREILFMQLATGTRETPNVTYH